MIHSGLQRDIMVGFRNGKYIIIGKTATRKELLHLWGDKPQAVEGALVSGQDCSPENP